MIHQHSTTDRAVVALQRTLSAPAPLDALQALTQLRTELDTLEFGLARRAIDNGASFGAVGRALGISRQAAHRRYRDPAARPQRTVVSTEVRGALESARREAARAGAEDVECEHVVLALAATGRLPARSVDLEAARVLIATRRAGAVPPARIGRRLRALLTGHGVPVDVDALVRLLPKDPEASRILERLRHA